MRLIDAKAMKKQLSRFITSKLGEIKASDIKKFIQEQPTVYNVDKVVKELEQQVRQYNRRSKEAEEKGLQTEASRMFGKSCSYANAIEIVKKGGVE